MFTRAGVPIDHLDCPGCDSEFTSFNGLRRHVAKCCPNEDLSAIAADLIFRCSWCQASFRDEAARYRHQNHRCKARPRADAPVVPTLTLNVNIDQSIQVSHAPPNPTADKLEQARQFLKAVQEDPSIWGVVFSCLSTESIGALERQLHEIKYHRELDEQHRCADFTIFKDRKTARMAVWNTYIGATVGECLCPLCEQQTIRQGDSSWECAHVVAEAHGGKLTLDNLRVICVTCNRSLGTLSLNQSTDFYPGSRSRLKLGDISAPAAKK